MIGKSLLHYEIDGTIGAGAMGQVYRARDTKLGRDVAIKMLPTSLRGNQAALQRFRREAQALAKLNHPNIVTIYSIEEQGEDLFLTMELVQGEALDSMIRDGGIDTSEFETIALPLTDAVMAAHARGIIHRDLKPSNIMITPGGSIKVLDFGVARVLSEQPLTDANITVGTAAYMSPEQISGKEVDGRSDLFSLGVLFYELLTGSRPFHGEHPSAVMYSIVHEDAPRLTSVPDVVASAVNRCLQKDPARRFASAEDLRKVLCGISSEECADSAASEMPAEITAALERNEWENAYRQLHRLIEDRPLSPHELEVLSDCAQWTDRFDESDRTIDAAFAGYSKAGQHADAARLALELVRRNLGNNAVAVARGWQKRAEHLLSNQPECIEHGLLLRRKTVNALGESDFERALELNRQCKEVADRCGDIDLQAEALHDHGQILVSRGDVEAGMELIDEAMTAAASGEVTPSTTGNLYCRTMVVCDSLADYKRAQEWSNAALKWCQPFGTSAYTGICRVHSAEAMRHHGRWPEAEEAVRAACDIFTSSGLKGYAGEAFNELGELSLRKGEYQEAEEAFREAVANDVDPVPGLALLRLAQGKGEAAIQTIQRALTEAGDNRLRQAKLLAARITIALGTTDYDLALSSADALDSISGDFKCPAFKAHAHLGRGAVALEKGNYEVASTELREAWSSFNRIGFTYDASRARTLLARAYLGTGNHEDARLQLEAAQRTFADLGARPDLETASSLLQTLP